MEVQPSIEPIYVLIPLILVLTAGFGIALGASSRQEIMANWPERRCDFTVMTMGHIYKPDSDKRTASEFSQAHFDYCTGALATKTLKSIFAPLFQTMKSQMGAANTMGNVFNSLRGSMADVFNPFSALMKMFWLRFKGIGALASRIFQQLYMAMKKVSGISVAGLYIAISLQTFFLNSIYLIIKVVLIIIAIIMAFVFIFFAPVIPILIILLIVIASIEGSFSGSIGGAASGLTFCFLRNTPILMKDGTTRNIQDLTPGAYLYGDDCCVEAVIQTPGAPYMYLLDGIYVTGSHRVWSKRLNKFVYVEDHEQAIRVSRPTDTMWTLITSTREIPALGSSGKTIVFADWKELPATFEGAMIWENIANELLNGKPKLGEPMRIPPIGDACIDKKTYVYKFQGGLVRAATIRKGDWIRDSKGWTQVTGIALRNVTGSINFKGSRMTDGVWVRQSNGSLEHPSGVITAVEWQGLHFISSTGSFNIYCDGEQFNIMDFTEVGYKRLSEWMKLEDAARDKKGVA